MSAVEANSTFQVLVLPLLTLVMSGVVASVVTFKLNARLQQRDFIRSRLEDAYASAHEYCNSLSTHFLKYFAVFREELDLNQANNLTIQQGQSGDPSHFRRLELLVGIYFPSVQPALEELLNSRGNLNRIVADYVRAYRTGDTDGRRLIPRLNEELSQVDRIGAKLKAVIVQEAKRLK